MSGIDRIIVTGDFLRFTANGGASQNGNIAWLYYLLRPVLGLLTDLKIDPIYCSEDRRGISYQLYSANDLQPSIDSWVSMYSKSPGARDLAILYDHFSCALVVSFELPEFIRQAFDVLDIPYIDFTIHPVRFMDDLIFGVRSNRLEVAGSLRPWVVPDCEIQIASGLAMASLSKLAKIPRVLDGANHALFACQTVDDKVLITQGKLLAASAFLDDFSDMCASHGTVFVKPHPYAKDNPVALLLTRLFPNAVTIDANFYHLLSHDEITSVYSITSSTSIEAAYFGKRGRHLAPYPYYFSENSASNGSFLTIHPELHSLRFWRTLLEVFDINVCSSECFELPRVKNRMRNSLRNFWGADIFGLT